ncbi:MAG: DUF1554 domain-containing protein, partial [Proteobacteria bacterium]|nr:DUF1554 domain-containing protein [Pseudomonadota bacterium]
GAATDTVTATSALQYKLVKASTEAAIDTVNEVDAITGANLVMDWTTATLTKDISGLSLATNYYFAVLVRDAAGNRRLYDIGLVSTDYLADPVAGGGGVFSIPNGTVAETSLTINWTAATDNATQTANLRYKVVAASSQAAIDTAAEADAITGSGLLMDWSSAVTSLDVTGLTPGTTYWFAILVEDLAGRKSLYTPVSQLTLDTHAPTVATGPSFSSVTTSSALVSWTAATDNGTTQSALQYKLVRASSSAAIDTVAEADAIAGGDIILNWTANTLSSTASGLADSTTHWFAVLVKDSLGNKALYGPASTQTLDASAPTLGSAITFNGFSSTIANQVTVNWGAATDVNSITPQASLKYKVVKAASSTAIDTQAEVDAITSGAALVMDWSTNILTINSTPINDGSSYYYTVAVKDLSGNEAIYTPVARSLRMFMTNTVSQGNLGGITGADAICEADTRHPTSSGVNVGTYKAMLVDGTNRIACVNASCSPTDVNDGLNWVMRASTLYVRTDGTEIKATNSSKIWTFPPNMTNSIAVPSGISGVWIGTDETFVKVLGNTNCSLWTSNGAVTGASGLVGSKSVAAVFASDSDCAAFSYPLYCVEQ